MQQTIFLEPEKVYHIYNRGTNKQAIFLCKKDYNHFLFLWEKYTDGIADCFAFCLLPNHFHFMIRIKSEEKLLKNPKAALLDYAELKYFISKQLSNLFNAYSRYFNIKYERDGKVFKERFKRKEVITDVYFLKLIEYIHCNPVKHGLTNDFKNYEYSSYWQHLLDEPTRLKREEVLDWYGSKYLYRMAHDTCEV